LLYIAALAIFAVGSCCCASSIQLVHVHFKKWQSATPTCGLYHWQSATSTCEQISTSLSNRKNSTKNFLLFICEILI